MLAWPGMPFSLCHRVEVVVFSEFRVLGNLSVGSAHAFISEMGISGVRPCRENENILKLVAK